MGEINYKEELALKNKVIDEMAEELEATAEFLDEEGIIMKRCFHKNKEEIKQYFINKAKENRYE